MSDYYCPHCGADLGVQPGFNPDAGYWTCTECGQFLTDPEDETEESGRFDGVGWFCDGCGSYLNKQRGFSDRYNTWTCTECGYVNNISEDEIYESEESFQASRKEELEEGSEEELEEEPEEDDDGYGYGEEWKYDHPRRCEYCDRLLNKQDGFEEWREYFTCEKCGHYNEWSLGDEDEDEEEYENEEEYEDEYEYDEEESSESYSEYEGSESIDDSDEDVESYFASEEYKRRVQAETQRKGEQERKQEELRRAKEAEFQQKQERKKEQRKRLWRIITRKKQEAGLSSEQCQHMRYEDVVSFLKNREFYNISVSGIEDLLLESISLEGTVGQISINGTTVFDASMQFPFNAKIKIVYHMLKTAAPPLTSRSAKRMDIEDVAWEFSNVGFRNIRREAIPDLIKGWFIKEDSVEKISIEGKTDFKKSDRFRLDAQIVISYHTFESIR